VYPSLCIEYPPVHWAPTGYPLGPAWKLTLSLKTDKRIYPFLPPSPPTHLDVPLTFPYSTGFHVLYLLKINFHIMEDSLHVLVYRVFSVYFLTSIFYRVFSTVYFLTSSYCIRLTLSMAIRNSKAFAARTAELFSIKSVYWIEICQYRFEPIKNNRLFYIFVSDKLVRYTVRCKYLVEVIMLVVQLCGALLLRSTEVPN